MRWKDVALIALVSVLLNVVRFWRGETIEWLSLVALFVLGYFVYRVRLRQWRRRLDQLRETRTRLAELSPEEQAAVRIALGERAPEETLEPGVERLFHYPRTPAVIREATFWLSVAFAAIAYLAIVFGWDVEERPYAIGIALFFTLSVGLQLTLWDRERATIRVTSSGLQSIAADGEVTGILWREIALIRSRQLLNCVDFYSRDGKRRARVGYHLLHFAQFMELVLAHLRELEHRT